jgi:acetyl-CoA carboxylase carboxyltransferase component
MGATALEAPARRPLPQERLEALCDPGSVQVLRSRVISSRLGARAVDGDGVVGATGAVHGRPIACYAQDGAFLGGSLGERHADTIVRVLQMVERARIPVVAFAESCGWPDAELGIMSARAAVGIVNRRELRVASDQAAERVRLADEYADEHLRADAAAASGFVDEIVEPAETRERLSWALLTLTGTRL